MFKLLDLTYRDNKNQGYLFNSKLKSSIMTELTLMNLFFLMEPLTWASHETHCVEAAVPSDGGVESRGFV